MDLPNKVTVQNQRPWTVTSQLESNGVPTVRRSFGVISMKLYYYMDCEYLRDNLQKKRVKVSRFGMSGSLNDPFEMAPYDISDPEFRSAHKRIVKDFAQDIGLICLSKTRYSPAMWAHYTKNHTGACLEFDVTYDHIIEVQYETEKLFGGFTLDTYRKHINA